MTAYFTDPMGEEFRKALQKALRQVKSTGEDDPDAVRRAGESKRGRKNAKSRKLSKQRFSKQDAQRLR